MRKIIYHIASSVDGFIAHKDGTVSRFLMEGEHTDDFLQSLSQYDTVIMGRKTYEFGFQFGLKSGEPAYKGLQHIIMSQSMSFKENNDVKLIAENQLSYLKQLKEKKGKAIWLCGGGKLAGYLLNHDLIDELILKINPIMLGNGIKVFENLRVKANFQHYYTKNYDNGVILQHFKQ